MAIEQPDIRNTDSPSGAFRRCRAESREQRSKTVLVVDDSPSIRHRLCEICGAYDFEVCAEAANGLEAIQKARQWNPELIILDLKMPVMGGLEAAPQLKKILPDTRIILFTLFGENLSQAALHNAGVTMVVSKSESLEALIKKARGLFHN